MKAVPVAVCFVSSHLINLKRQWFQMMQNWCYKYDPLEPTKAQSQQVLDRDVSQYESTAPRTLEQLLKNWYIGPTYICHLM